MQMIEIKSDDDFEVSSMSDVEPLCNLSSKINQERPIKLQTFESNKNK